MCLAHPAQILEVFDSIMQNEAQVPATTVINDGTPDIKGCEKGRTVL